MSTIEQVVDEVRSLGAVVILGAGASFRAGMPLAGKLGPLVWHTLESSPVVLNDVCTRLGVEAASAKQVIGDDSFRLSRAFTYIAADPCARQVFQSSVVDLDNVHSAKQSKAHTALARLIFSSAVLGVVSFNWDTLLERAFEARYGFSPFGKFFDLWKPHGDSRRPFDAWVLPHQTGLVPQPLLARITELARVRPRVLLIVGYSERDEAVVESLIAPLSERWRVFRVGPDAIGEGAIEIDADAMLTEVADELAPEPDTIGWRSVSFTNQRGIEAAVAGERLGPRDVASCPQLPHFETALQQLETLNCAHVSGASGSGKSITTWQLAYHYNKEGWHVLRPDVNGDFSNHRMSDLFRAKRWPTVLVVDDTQFLSRSFVEELLELPDDRTKLILGTTDADWQQERTVRISSSAAVRAIAEEFRARRNEILSIVQQFDSHVGDAFLSTRIEDRIAAAERSSTPWQFAYALRGGWRLTRQILNAAQDFDESDLLLTAIAVRQLSSLDAGASLPQLIRDAQALGRDEAWVRSGIRRLEAQNIVLCGETVRCLHLRSAAAIVDLSLNSRSRDNAERLARMIRSLASETEVPLRGISWLLHEIGRYGSLVLRSETKRVLLNRCANAREHDERRDASFVISSLLGHKDDTATDILEQHRDLIRAWIIQATAEDAYAIGGVVNSLYNDNKEQCKQLVDSIPPLEIAAKLSRIQPKDGYVWGHFLGRLSVACTAAWRSHVSESLPREDIRHNIDLFSIQELSDLSELIHGIAGFDFDFALECCELGLPAYKASFSKDALTAYRDTSSLEHWVLGNPLFDRARPSQQQRNLAKAMFDSIEPDAITEQILSCPFGDWEYYARLLDWIRQILPRKVHEVVEALDWDELDVIIGAKWQHPPRELRLLLNNLTKGDDGEPVRSWVAARSPRIETIDPLLAGISPEAAIFLLRHGKRVDLGGHNRSDWSLQAWALERIAAVERDAARSAVRLNEAHFLKSITEISLPEGLPEYLDLIHELDNEFLPEIISTLDPADVEEWWAKALKDHRHEERQAAGQTLRKIVAVGNARACDLADELLRAYEQEYGLDMSSNPREPGFR